MKPVEERTCMDCFWQYHCPATQEGLDLAVTCPQYEE